jgi:hypothetical protein
MSLDNEHRLCLPVCTPAGGLRAGEDEDEESGSEGGALPKGPAAAAKQQQLLLVQQRQQQHRAQQAAAGPVAAAALAHARAGAGVAVNNLAVSAHVPTPGPQQVEPGCDDEGSDGPEEEESEEEEATETGDEADAVDGSSQHARGTSVVAAHPAAAMHMQPWPEGHEHAGGAALHHSGTSSLNSHSSLRQPLSKLASSSSQRGAAAAAAAGSEGPEDGSSRAIASQLAELHVSGVRGGVQGHGFWEAGGCS